MYSNKDNVNILTALLIKHGVRHAVLCPGSRNSPIVHNLRECGKMACYPVTDERSAAFFALGMCQALDEPVVVCVTSGSALLNVAPAVAEACYQHQPLIVVSADRPTQWIDQLDGQTLPQVDALGRFVKRAVSLPESADNEQRWYCNRLVNESMIASGQGSGGPVHINVPISEPLFDYNVAALPDERFISLRVPISTNVDEALLEKFRMARKPMIVMGQMKRHALPPGLCESLETAGYVVMQERLSSDDYTACYLDEAVSLVETDDSYLPDFILYVGGTLVSKRTRRFLRKAKLAECWEINVEGMPHDVLMNLSCIIQAQPVDVLSQLRSREKDAFWQRWQELKMRVRTHQQTLVPPYSQMYAVQALEHLTACEDPLSVMHYANSMAVRMGNIFSGHYIYCNRGVNGIEGSLSAAAGFSVVTEENVYCVIGDLSFFYDQNALWNRNLRGNLRILLLNNGGGGIFYQLDGLKQSDACDEFVVAQHHTTAEGICRQNGIAYYSAGNKVSLDNLLHVLTCAHSDRPILLEVQTDAEGDALVYRKYYQMLKTKNYSK